MNAREVILAAYAAFNRRDIDAALALMSEHVSWPKASEGGRVVGKQEIRDYWTRQWAEFDPRVDIIELIEDEMEPVEVRVRQLVKDRKGNVVSDTEVHHVYTIADGLIQRMDVKTPEGGAERPTAAFSSVAVEQIERG